MIRIKVILLLIGIGLLTIVFQSIDIQKTIELLQHLGFGFLLILFLYLIAFIADTITWQLTINKIPLNRHWLYRLFQLRLSGEAFNNITPFGGMGGEPIKAILLKKYYKIDYSTGIASIILAKSINIISLVIFLLFGLFFVIDSPNLGDPYKYAAAFGLALLSLGIFLFVAIQRYEVTSKVFQFASNRNVKDFIKKWLESVRKIENNLISFYSVHKSRLILALCLGLANWILGVFEIYFTMKLIGQPISLLDAWIIETAAQLVRAGAFMIPAGIGIQEGAFVLVGSAITGSPVSAFTAAITRRIREIVWIVWGLLVFYFSKPKNENFQFSEIDTT